MADLIFSRPPYAGGPVNLVFGATDGPALLPVSVVGASALGGISGSGAVVLVPRPVAVSGVSALGGVSAAGVALYDNRNPRRASVRATMPHQVAAQRPGATASGWRQGVRTIVQPLGLWRLATPTRTEPVAVWQPSAKADTKPATPWGQGTARAHQAAMAHQVATPRRGEALAVWETGQARARQVALVHQSARSWVRQALAQWQQAQARQVTTLARSGKGVARLSELLAFWETARPVPPGLELWPPVRPMVPPRVPSTHLVFACPPWAGGAVHLVFGRVCAYTPALVSVPVRRVYVIINSIDLRRVAGDVPLPADAFSLTLDADSRTLSWSTSLHKSAEPLVSVFDELEARINGVPYRVAVGKVARDRRFPQTRLKVSGRGLAQVLTDPQAPVLSYYNTAQRTAQQLMADVLTVNGVSMGWDIDWGLTDWLVPANAWAFRGTAMQALADIAGAAGGYIQPHPTARTLRVLPRYPAAPWTWGSMAPDIELPAAVCEVESYELVERPGYNRVYVGGESQGVFGPVTRTGTAGDMLAPQVTHPLITDSAAHRQRGLAELADSGSQVHLSLTLPVLPETGLILPGTMARYTADQTRMGIVRSTSLTWSSPVMRQTIGLECHEPA